jgi:uncharacterized protein YkwD
MTVEDGISYYDWNSAQQIARQTVDDWMQSPRHRKNILADRTEARGAGHGWPGCAFTPHWQRQGIGIGIGPGNKVLVTQNFC